MPNNRRSRRSPDSERSSYGQQALDRGYERRYQTGYGYDDGAIDEPPMREPATPRKGARRKKLARPVRRTSKAKRSR